MAVEQDYLKRTTVDFFLAHLFDIDSHQAISVAKPYEILKKYSEHDLTWHQILDNLIIQKIFQPIELSVEIFYQCDATFVKYYSFSDT